MSRKIQNVVVKKCERNQKKFYRPGGSALYTNLEVEKPYPQFSDTFRFILDNTNELGDQIQEVLYVPATNAIAAIVAKANCLNLFFCLSVTKGNYRNMRNYKESKYNFLFTYDDESTLAYNSKTCALAKLDKEHTQTFKDFIQNDVDITDEKFLSDLKVGGYLVDENSDEISAIRYNLFNSRYSNNGLSLTIAPTSDCNFRCVYCYEKASLKDSKMSLDIQNRIIDFVRERSKNLSYLNIAWYGGEPLMTMDIISYLSSAFLELCEENNITYSASIVTNGYLLNKKTAKEFEKYSINNVQITLDGPEDIHNARRPLANGKGTFNKIISNLKECVDDIKNITIRVNTDLENAGRINEVIQAIDSNGLKGKVGVYLGLVESTNDSYIKDKCMGIELFSKTSFQFSKDNGLNLMHFYPAPKANYCGADGASAFVVDPEGYVYKCWNDIGLPEKRITAIITEEMGPAPINPLLYDYMFFDPTQHVECKECKVLPICMGGCPNRRLSESENLCCDKKFVLEEFLKDCAKEIIDNKSKKAEAVAETDEAV